MIRRVAGAMATGALVGLCMLGIEELSNLVAGQARLAGDEATRLLPWYLLGPAALALPAAAVRPGGGRVLAAATAVWAVVWGGVAAMILGERGAPAPAVLGFGGFGLLALGATVLLLRRVGDERARWGLAAAAVAFLPAFRALNLNAFGSPGELWALVTDAGLVVGAALVGLLAAALSPRLSRPALPAALALAPGAMALGLSLLSAPPRPSPAPPAAAPRPDVVLVVVDTLRADHLGAWGYGRPTSPQLDALAARGTVYLDATSPAPWTLPSFASLQTGVEPHRHGAGVNPGERNTQAPLGPDLPTVAERLAQAGYRTGAIVSNPYLKASFGLDRGYAHYDDALGLAHMMMLLHPLDQLPFRAMPDRSYRLAPRMVAAAERFWADTEGGPRFLMLHMMDPHKPYNPPEQDQRAVAGPGPDQGPGSHQDPVEALYDAEIRFLDRSVGPFLERVVADGGLVLLTADHGEEFSDHQGAYPGERWPADVRHGHTLYQEQLHVPLLVVGAGAPAARIERPVRSLDVVPTILHAAGAAPVEGDGQPLAEALGLPVPGPLPRRAQAIRYGTEKRAVIDPLGRKLIRSTQGDEVYDLATDRGERRNLATGRGDLVQELAPQLPGESEGEAAEIDPALLEQLRAVGYVDP
ncbi:sulfatase [Myxococcota bacterium]|nr:sulfatase [Myxococcota bacterium]